MTIAEPTKVEAPSKHEGVFCALAVALACVATFLAAQLIASGAILAFNAFSRLAN